MSKTKAVLCLILLFLVIGKAHASDHYQVIVHPDVGQESITANVLRAIFSMRMKTWPNGRLIKVYVLPDDHELHQAFSKETLNVFLTSCARTGTVWYSPVQARHRLQSLPAKKCYEE